MQSEHFIFDGIKSADMNQYLIRMDGGGISSPFFGGQDIQEVRMKNKITPYHFGTEKEPIEFTIQISPLDKEWTPQKRNKIGKWLIHEDYKLFQTADDLGKYYYVIATEASEFELYNNDKGFITITFRSNSPYAWSPIYVNSYDLSTNTTTTIIELDNLSNINKNYRPKIEIELVGGETGVQLRNLSNGGQIFKFEGLSANERVSIDNENEVIKSDIPLSNPFLKFNRNFLELVYGTNRIEVTGKCKIWTKMQFPILQ